MQVCGDNSIKRLWLQNHTHSHSVDEHFVSRNVRIFLPHLVEDFVPKHHAVALGVGLGHHGEMLTGSGGRGLEGEVEYAFEGDAGELDGRQQQVLVGEYGNAGVLDSQC